MSSANQGDRFIEVTRGSKKRKASTSPTLPNQTKPSSPENPPGTPVRPRPGSKPYRKNTIPLIISGVDEKFKSWRKLTGGLRQYHPSLKISMIKELPKGDFVAIGDSLQDVIILRNKSKMKAALGKTLRLVSLKPSKPAKNRQKSCS